jgi:hypothetical protein
MFELKKDYSLPVIAMGMAWWDIVHTSAPNHTFCSYHFPAANPQHPGYKDHIAGAKAAAQCVVDQLNKAPI